MADDTEKKRRWKVRPKSGGSWLYLGTDELETLEDMIDAEAHALEDGEHEAGYELVPVMMTDAEVEALGEFDGW